MNQICNTTSTTTTLLGNSTTTTETTCQPLTIQIPDRSIDFYWGFLLTALVFALGFIFMHKWTQHKKII